VSHSTDDLQAPDLLATFRDAMAKLRRETGTKLDDDEALLLMARQVLGGPADAGRSSYQVSVSVCARCQQGYVQGGGDPVEIGAEVVAMAECDAQELGHTHLDASAKLDSPAPARVTQTIPPKVFLGLKGLGFRETDARKALDAVAHGGESGPVTAEALLRRALAVLT